MYSVGRMSVATVINPVSVQCANQPGDPVLLRTGFRLITRCTFNAVRGARMSSRHHQTQNNLSCLRSPEVGTYDSIRFLTFEYPL